MFNRLFFFLIFSFPVWLFSQVQYTIADVPVCWNDSSLIKYQIVTTQGGFLDLGYFDQYGNPVTVAGGTIRTGFCSVADSLSIDSTGRIFTINFGDQSVSFNAGSEYLADLLDVDTTGLDSNYILKYSPTAGEWLVYDNDLNGLSDGYSDARGNVVAGYIPADSSWFNQWMQGIQNTSFGNGLFRLRTGNENTTVGFTTLPNLRTGSDNIGMGVVVSWYDTSAVKSIMMGNRINTRTGNFEPEKLGSVRLVNSIVIGVESNTKDTFATNEIVIGTQTNGNGSNSATLGNANIDSTFLRGDIHLTDYGSGSKTAGSLSKTRSAYLAGFATDGTIIEIDTTGLFPGGGGIDSIFGFNGLTAVGSDSVKLGGTLVENTGINMDSFQISYTNNGGTFISGDGNIGFTSNSTTAGNSTFAMGNLGTRFSNDYGDSLALHTVNLSSIRSGVRELDLRSEKSNDNDVYTMIALSPERFAMKTPNVVNLSATPGMFLKLVNQATGQVEFDTISGGGGSGFTLPTDSITFNDNNGSAVAGKLQRNDTRGTLVYGSPTGAELDLHPPGWYVKNQTGATIPRGTVVRAAGTLGNSGRILIDLMVADGSIEGKYLLGVTAEDIPDNSDGWVFSQGRIKPVNLTAYNDGDVLFVSTTVPGALTDTIPVAPDLILPIGFVVHNTSNGTLAVRVTFQATVTAENGLTATATADNTNIRLGGDLLQTTKIDGQHTYGFWLDSLTFLNAYARGDIRLRSDSTTFGTNSFLTFDDFSGLSMGNFSSLNNTQSTLAMLRNGEMYLKQEQLFSGVNYDHGLRVNPAESSISMYSENSDNTVLTTRLKLSPDKVLLTTPNVYNNSVVPGEVLMLSDSATGEIDFFPLSEIESDTSVSIDFKDLPAKIYQLDFTGKSTATLAFSNVKIGAVYVIHVLNSTAGDVITFPPGSKTETGATLTSVTLSGTGRIFTFYFDSVNFYIK